MSLPPSPPPEPLVDVELGPDILHRILCGVDSRPEGVEALRKALVEERGLKPRLAFGPVRIAVSGRKISPPLFESLELLGRERSLSRLRDAMSA